VKPGRGGLRVQRLFTASAAGAAERRLGSLQEASALKPTCPACVQGPSKVDGHPGLRVQALGPSHITFTCLNCDTVWSRNYVQDATYAWELLATPGTGIFIPGMAPRSLIRRRHGD
jgi:hypothetical protein